MSVAWKYWDEEKPQPRRYVLCQDARDGTWIASLMEDGSLDVYSGANKETKLENCLRWIYLEDLSNALEGKGICG